MTFDLTEDERYGVIEAVEKGLDDRNDYMTYGNPHTDYGEEWPETAREQAPRWRHCASAVRKVSVVAMADTCEALARRLDASATEYEQQEASR